MAQRVELVLQIAVLGVFFLDIWWGIVTDNARAVDTRWRGASRLSLGTNCRYAVAVGPLS